MKIFMCGSGYSINSIIDTIDYVLNFDASEIVLLKENYLSTKKYSTKGVAVFNTLDECVSNSDYTIILNNENFPKNTLKEIERLVNVFDKKIIPIDISYDNDYGDDTSGLMAGNVEIPTVLVLVKDLALQGFSTEIKLNRVLKNRGIRAIQKFSGITKKILSQIDEQKSLNTSLVYQIENSNVCGDIFVSTIYIGNNMDNMKDHIPYFSLLKADYVVLQADYRFDQYDIAEKIVQYWCFSKLDGIIKSRYTNINENHTVFCDSFDNKNVMYVNEESLEEKIIDSITSKLALPKRCKRII